jgi:hypothetical protein
MPRKAPEKVQEMRITLGDFERKLITKQLEEDDLLNKVKAGAEIGKTIAITGAVVGGTIAAATVGGLAVSAYREANQLVEGVQDLSAGIWSTFKWRVGLTSFDDYLGEVEDIAIETEEEKAEKERRKNMGILEWGLDRVLVFLLGADKQWTSTTLVPKEEKQQNGGHDETPLVETQYGSVENFNRIQSEKLQFLSAIAQFCDVGGNRTKDFDPQLCEEVRQDYADWQRRNNVYE